jgi:hypothetical protein
MYHRNMDDKDLAQARIEEHGPKVGSRFRHYKGGEYVVIANALEEATLNHLVVYRAPKGTVWTRPIDDWNAMVEVDGNTVRRFTPID